jgi:hypothetical protein
MLRCEECGKGAATMTEALGWRAFVTAEAVSEQDEVAGHQLREEPTLAVYCPECAEREFPDAVA